MSARYLNLFHYLLCLSQNVFPLHRGVVDDKLSQSFLHFRVKCFLTCFFFLYFLCMEPSEDILGMDVELPGFGSDNFWEASIRCEVELSNSANEFSLELDCVAFVGDGSLSLLVLFAFSFRFGACFELTFIEFFGFFFELLVDLAEFEFTQHDDRVWVLEPFEFRSVFLYSSKYECFGLWRYHWR